MANQMDVVSRGETVLAELKLLVSISHQTCAAPSESSRFQSRVSSMDKENNPKMLDSTRPTPVAITFPRRRTQSTFARGRKSSTSEETDENILPIPAKISHNNCEITRTLRRTISGGLCTILRPFQPPAVKVQYDQENEKKSTSVQGFRRIRRTVSSNLAKAILRDDNRQPDRRSRVHETSPIPSTPKTKRPEKKHANAAWNRSQKAKARESVCSRNSTISVLEYLAARRRNEEAGPMENLVPLSEYGRNCHLYGCDSPHIWNPDKNSSREIIHCDCDNDHRSRDHEHIDDDMTIFYKPGNSDITVHNQGDNTSSLATGRSNTSLAATLSTRPSNPVPSAMFSSSSVLQD
ncbi:hypothetical protein CPB86DRAFT_786689 [Serendipita vermifera]|nr:hypothetical protein CPB86DRAFT_786689 [Serendipita vermifera]